jgi:hypothetical protein
MSQKSLRTISHKLNKNLMNHMTHKAVRFSIAQLARNHDGQIFLRNLNRIGI